MHIKWAFAVWLKRYIFLYNNIPFLHCMVIQKISWKLLNAQIKYEDLLEPPQCSRKVVCTPFCVNHAIFIVSISPNEGINSLKLVSDKSQWKNLVKFLIESKIHSNTLLIGNKKKHWRFEWLNIYCRNIFNCSLVKVDMKYP